MANKGTPFEREVCKTLSLWWTGQERDDVFWRTDTSGGRAKSRMKAGKETFGQYGDVQASDPIGQPLIDLCTIELKRGYNRTSIMDMLDAKDHAAQQQWDAWIEKLLVDHVAAGTQFWMLIWRRDRRAPLLFLPHPLFVLFSLRGLAKVFRMRLLLKDGTSMACCAMLFETFLEHVTPKAVLDLVEVAF